MALVKDFSVSVDGLRDLDRALGQLAKATAKGVMRRVLLKAGAPIENAARGLAPDDPATPPLDLHTSIDTSTKLGKRQARLNRKQPNKSFVEAFVGAGVIPQAHLIEFGTDHSAPQPFMRPAWDANKMKALDIIKSELGQEIEKTAKRAAVRAAKLLARSRA